MLSIYDQFLATLYQIWRKRWFGLLVLWGICLIGWGVIATIPDEYEASARIFVDTNTVLPRVAGVQTTNVLRQVDIVRRTLVSRPNLEKVIRRTDLDLTIQNEGDMEKLIEDLTKNITLKSQGDDLFTLTYRAGSSDRSDKENANLAKRVVQNLINIFVEGGMVMERDNFVETRRFLDEQVRNYERQLEAAEKRKAEFETANFGFIPGDANFTQRLQNIQREVSDVTRLYGEAQNSRRALASQLGATPANVPGAMIMMGGGPVSIDAGSAAGQLQSARATLNALKARGFTDQHPDVISAEAQVESLKAQLDAERRAPKVVDPSYAAPSQPNPVYVNLKSRLFELDAQVASLASRRAALTAEQAELQSKAETMPAVEAEMSKLNRDYAAVRKQYDELVAAREDINVGQQVVTNTDKVQFRIVDPPEVPLKPVAPNRPLLLSLILAVGLGAGVATSFLASQMHTTYVNVNKLRFAFNIPVLGAVSAIMSDQERSQQRLWMGLFAIGFVGVIGIYLALLVLEIAQRSTPI